MATRRILAVDPGPTRSALVYYDGAEVMPIGILENESALLGLSPYLHRPGSLLAVEWIESFGMAVGREVFETVYWTGRYVERWGGEVLRVPRRQVKLHLCGSARANDANIRAALLDRFGPGRALAVGTKAKPGPLYGIRRDLWAALAVAVTAADGAVR